MKSILGCLKYQQTEEIVSDCYGDEGKVRRKTHFPIIKDL
jgi:hypothetical protein